MQLRLSRALPVVAAFATALYGDVATDYNHKVDFGRYHTYSWIGVKAGNQLWQDRIMSAVDSQLAAKGWTKVASGGDACVAAIGKISERDILQTWYDGFPGWGWGGWDGMSTTIVEPNRVGTLTLDIFDGNTKQMIWHGVSSHTLSNKPEKNTKKLDHAIAEMFDHFPPKSKG